MNLVEVTEVLLENVHFTWMEVTAKKQTKKIPNKMLGIEIGDNKLKGWY